MDLLSIDDKDSTATGRFFGQETPRDGAVRELRLAVYLENDRHGVPAGLLDCLRRFCGRDVTVLTPASAMREASANPESAPLIDIARAIEQSLFINRGRTARPSLVVLAALFRQQSAK